MSLLHTPTGIEHDWALNHWRPIVAGSTLAMADYDPNTAIHGACVGYGASEAAATLVQHFTSTSWKLTNEDAVYVGIAGALHDYGKLTVPQYMLDPQLQFTEYEYSVLASHPIEGFKIVDELLTTQNEAADSTRQLGIIASSILMHHLLQAKPYPALDEINTALKQSKNFTMHNLESLLEFAPHTLLVIGADKSDAMARAYRSGQQGPQALLSRLVRGVTESGSQHESLFSEYFTDDLVLGLRTIANFQNSLRPPVELRLVDEELDSPDLGILRG